MVPLCGKSKTVINSKITDNQKQKKYICQMGRRLRDEETQRRGQGMKKIEVYYVQVPTPHKECSQYALQKFMNKNKN